MKLFTKLTALSSCWQSPHHSVSGFEQETSTTSLNPQPKKRRAANSSGHWRPALTVISEDNCGGDEIRKMKMVQKEKRVKVVRTRAKPSYSEESSWKIQAQIAIPAFSPAPFMF